MPDPQRFQLASAPRSAVMTYAEQIARIKQARTAIAAAAVDDPGYGLPSRLKTGWRPSRDRPPEGPRIVHRLAAPPEASPPEQSPAPPPVPPAPPALVPSFTAHFTTAQPAMVGLGYILYTIYVREPAVAPILVRLNRRILIAEVQDAVCRHYDMSRADLLSARRAIAIVRPRQVAMYLCSILTLHSISEIGRRFLKDHTTALHAVRKIEAMIRKDKQLAEDVAALTRIVTAQP